MQIFAEAFSDESPVHEAVNHLHMASKAGADEAEGCGFQHAPGRNHWEHTGSTIFFTPAVKKPVEVPHHHQISRSTSILCTLLAVL